MGAATDAAKTVVQERGRVLANRMALVFIALLVLELVLIGHQVQPLKAIKKKILLKKLKKILPLLALVKKPKKKLILVPIPIPMFNKPMMDMPMMDNYEMPMQDSYSSGSSGGGGGGYSQESNQEKGGGGGGY